MLWLELKLILKVFLEIIVTDRSYLIIIIWSDEEWMYYLKWLETYYLKQLLKSFIYFKRHCSFLGTMKELPFSMIQWVCDCFFKNLIPAQHRTGLNLIIKLTSNFSFWGMYEIEKYLKHCRTLHPPSTSFRTLSM